MRPAKAPPESFFAIMSNERFVNSRWFNCLDSPNGVCVTAAIAESRYGDCCNRQPVSSVLAI